jgi:L-lysine exporter family protein LysE/ArgO
LSAALTTGFFTGLSLIVAIGAQNAFVLRLGLLRRHRLPVALICSLADAALIGAGVYGFGLAASSIPALLDIARWSGAAFLAAYGTLAAHRAWRGESLADDEARPMALLPAVTLCLALTFLNPHVYLDTVILLGSLANQHGEHGRWHFGAGAVLASLSWFFLLAYGARALRPLFARPLAWRILDGSIAIVMWTIAFGLTQTP